MFILYIYKNNKYCYVNIGWLKMKIWEIILLCFFALLYFKRKEFLGLIQNRIIK